MRDKIFGALLAAVVMTAAFALPVRAEQPFTPDGQATVTDHVMESNGKEFFTFTTPAGNVFFLIIDHDRPLNNVYFLNAVTEQDLIALTDGAISTGNAGGTNNDVTAIPTPSPSPSPTPTPAVPPNVNEPPPPSPTPPTQSEQPPAPAQPTQDGINVGTIVFLLIGMVMVGGVGYYVKVVRPKQQRDMDDGEDEDMDEGEEMVFEDEAEELEIIEENEENVEDEGDILCE